jgi:diacylglycerol kinase (CTP)
MPLPAAHDIHLARRLWHFFGVMFMAGLEWNLDHRQAVIVALSCATFMIGFDVCRLYSRRLNALFTWLFGAVLREHERRRIAGSTMMMAGVALIVCLYPRLVVILTLMLFATADPLASFVGIRFGRDKLVGNKSLQGSLAAFVACFVVSLLFYISQDLMRERLFIACLLTGLIGAGAELIPVGRLDDNFVFPMVTATLLTGLFYVFEGF